MASEKRKPGYEATKAISKYIRTYYQEVYQAEKEGKPIAWLTGLAPVELMYAMDIVPFFPENYNAFCAAKQVSVELCEEAEARDYSRDLCSYARTNLGSCLTGKGPLGTLPKPDFLFCTRNCCTTHAKWWEELARIYNKPLYILDVPQVDPGQEGAGLDYVVSQLEDFVKFVEKVTGHKFDEKKFAWAMDNADKAGKHWAAVKELRKNVPCPISAPDIFSDMFVCVALTGSEIGVKLLADLEEEVRARVKEGRGVVEEEKARLLWDNITIWYNLGLLAYLEQYGAVTVIETYTSYTGWGAPFDFSRGLMRALAKKYAHGYINMSLDAKLQTVLKIADEYKINGALLFSNRSCKPYSMGQPDIQKALETKGVSSIIFEADMVDSRHFAEAEIKNRLDAFVETLR